MSSEKRKSPRYSFPVDQKKKIPAAVEVDGARYVGSLLDISRTGMAIRVNHEVLKISQPSAGSVGDVAVGEFWFGNNLFKFKGKMARLVGQESVAIKFDQNANQSVLDELIGGEEGFGYWGGESLRIVGVLDSNLLSAVSAAVKTGKSLDLRWVTKVNSSGVEMIADALGKRAVLHACSHEAKSCFEKSGLCVKCGKCSGAPANVQHHQLEATQAIAA